MDGDPIPNDLGEDFEGLDAAKKREQDIAAKKLDKPGSNKYAQAICNNMFESKTAYASQYCYRITYGVPALDERSPEESVG